MSYLAQGWKSHLFATLPTQDKYNPYISEMPMPKSALEQDQMVGAHFGEVQTPPEQSPMEQVARLGNSIQSTLAERGKQYGEFRTQAEICQHLKDTMTVGAAHAGWLRLTNDQREALEMIQHKIARILNGNPNHHDSWHDIAGYAQLVANRLAKDQSNAG